MKRIVFTGGGTAGHIYPCLALADYLDGWEKFYVGSHGMEEQILKRFAGIEFHAIECAKFDRVKKLKNLSLPFKLWRSIRSAKKVLEKIRPDVVFSKGGYVAVPVARACKKLGIKLVTHESDLSLGLANKLISRTAQKVCLTFDSTPRPSEKYVCTGQPIRREILNAGPTHALTVLGYPNKKIILFVGGSLGAVKINSLLSDPTFLTKSYCVVHAVGKNNPLPPKQENYFPFAYLDDIGSFYACADLVVTRAGSGAINELLALKKPMLMLPLSKNASRGDQVENAKLFSKLGYGEMIEDEKLNRDNLLKTIEKMMKNLDFYKKNLLKAGENHACEKIVKILEQLA